MINFRVFILCIVFCFIWTSAVKPKFSLASQDVNIDDIVSSLTLKEKIGQMIMPSFRYWESKGKRKPFQKINKEIESLFKEYRFGGIILFSENFNSLKQTVKLTSDLENVMLNISGFPMFIAVDQEGGYIVRLKWATRIPVNMVLGAVNDIDLSFNYGKVIAEELKALGINIDFVSCLDVKQSKQSSYRRSFYIFRS
jgi:beta-N-acetylhexosaminidase